jgi:hypothetical protein
LWKTFQPTRRLKLDGDNTSLAREIATSGYGPTLLVMVNTPSLSGCDPLVNIAVAAVPVTTGQQAR